MLAQNELNKLHLINTIDQNIDGYVFYQLLLKKDGHVKFLYISDQIVKYNSHSIEEIKLNPRLLYDNVHPDYKEYLQNLQEESYRELSNFQAEFPLYINKHEIRWLSLVSVPIKKENGDVIWNGIQIDITEKKKQELKIQKQNRILHLLNTINDEINEFNNTDKLLENVIKSIVNIGSYKLVWICIKPEEDAENQIVKAYKSYGVTEYLNDISIDLNDPKMSLGPTATALNKKGTTVVNNMTIAENFKPWLEIASKYGLRSSAVFPLTINGKAASINIYSDELDSFNDDELELLNRIIRTLNNSIRSIETEIEKNKYEVERQLMIDDLTSRNERLEKFAFVVSHVLRAPVANILGLISLIKEDKENTDKYLKLLDECILKLDSVVIELNETLQQTKSEK